jgi:hypothetical protein
MGRAAVADITYGASATVQVWTQGGLFDGQVTNQGVLTAQESRIAQNTFSKDGVFAQTNADATARVDATAVDPATHHPFIDFAGHAHTDNVGGIYAGYAIADMKYTDVVSLRPYFGITPDPNYAPGVQHYLLFKVSIDGSISNSFHPFNPQGYPWSYYANSLVRLEMNSGQTTDLTATTSEAFSQHPNSTVWSTYNWDSINVQDNGNFQGTKTFRVPYDLGDQGYAFALEAILRTDASLGGLADISGLHSAHLVGITYADGSTPESHGWQIVDKTGFPSPNLPLAVPEPSSLLFASLGLAAVALKSIGRRRR